MESSPFVQKSVSEVQDSCIELRNNVGKLRDEFRERLKSRYDDVIRTNESVIGLYEFARKVDGELLELCLGDDEHLPRISDVELTVDRKRKAREYDRTNESGRMLQLSKWIVSMEQFKQNPTSEEKFTLFIKNFSELQITEHVVRYWRELAEWLLREKPELKVESLLSLLNVVNLKQLELDSTIRDWIFDRVLSENLSPELDKFISAEEFRSIMCERLVNQCSIQFERWENRDHHNIIAINPYDTNKIEAVLVDDIHKYQMGIVDSERLLFFQIKSELERLLNQIARFDHSDIYASTKQRLQLLIHNERERISSISEQPDKSSSMDALVNNMLAVHNRTKYITYLDT